MSHEINTRSAGSDPLPTTLFGSYVWGPELMFLPIGPTPEGAVPRLIRLAAQPSDAAILARLQGCSLPSATFGVCLRRVSPPFRTQSGHTHGEPAGWLGHPKGPGWPGPWSFLVMSFGAHTDPASMMCLTR